MFYTKKPYKKILNNIAYYGLICAYVSVVVIPICIVFSFLL